MLKSLLCNRLKDLEQNDLLRRLRHIEGAQGPSVRIDGREVLLLCSNNYLDLANHPSLRRAAREAIEMFGCGAGASRLISGSMELHELFESRIASFKGTEAALLFPSGYHANIGLISALAGEGDTILSDELNHASIIDGCRLARARISVYRHRDMTHLEDLLREAPPSGRRLIVTDSVFSMDGDLAPLQEIVALAERTDSFVMVDEAHATGVFGEMGAGLAEELGLSDRIDVQMGTLGKSLGGWGAYAAGSRDLIDWLVNRSRSFIYTTALAPVSAAIGLAALEVVRREPDRRLRLWKNTRFLRQGLRELGYGTGASQSPILPVIVGEARATLELSNALFERGVFAYAVRPPTVPDATSRIRVTTTAGHDINQLTRALQAFREAGKETGILK